MVQPGSSQQPLDGDSDVITRHIFRTISVADYEDGVELWILVVSEAEDKIYSKCLFVQQPDSQSREKQKI